MTTEQTKEFDLLRSKVEHELEKKRNDRTFSITGNELAFLWNVLGQQHTRLWHSGIREGFEYDQVSKACILCRDKLLRSA